MRKLVLLNKSKKKPALKKPVLKRIALKKPVLKNGKFKSIKAALKRRRMTFAKGVSFLPHLFTLGNAFFGFLSIIFSAKGSFVASSYCILIGMLMDALDGRIARLVGATSALGVELDSLSDAVSFCVAPAVLIYFSLLHNLESLGILACTLYLVSGLFRLARFNIISDQQSLYFLGLPTTAAACLIVSIFLNIKSYAFSVADWSATDWSVDATIIMFFITLLLAGLMVGNVHFPTFKRKKIG